MRTSYYFENRDLFFIYINTYFVLFFYLFLVESFISFCFLRSKPFNEYKMFVYDFRSVNTVCFFSQFIVFTLSIFHFIFDNFSMLVRLLFFVFFFLLHTTFNWATWLRIRPESNSKWKRWRQVSWRRRHYETEKHRIR